MSCLASATETAEVFSAISAARARTAGSSSSSGSTREMSRPPSASAASKTRPVATHSIACEMPTTLGRNQLDAASGTRPLRADTNPNRADCPAIRTSAGSVIVAPTPTAGPLTATITGFARGGDPQRHRAAPVARHPANRLETGALGGPDRIGGVERAHPRPRSAPAQKARPAPVISTARTSSSSSAASKAATSSRAIVVVNAMPVTKPGTYDLSVDGEVLVLKEAKPLPARD
jgi:hypothetical protein